MAYAFAMFRLQSSCSSAASFCCIALPLHITHLKSLFCCTALTVPSKVSYSSSRSSTTFVKSNSSSRWLQLTSDN